MSASDESTPSQLIGQGASEEDIATIEAALLRGKEVRRIIRLKTVVGADGEIFVGAKIDVSPTYAMNEISVIVNLAERRITDAVPQATHVFIEPDVYLDPNATQPATSTIVLLSED